MLHATLAAFFLLLPLTVHAVDGPHFQAIEPNRGPTAGGTLVQIKGEHFDQLNQGIIGAVFGSSIATDVTYVSPNLITAIAPSHSDGSVFVKLTINGVTVGSYGRRVFYFDEGGTVSTTTTTTQPGATTTTTLVCGGCADGDPCTVDSCVVNTCVHTVASRTVDLTTQATECAGQTVPDRIGGRFLLACDLVREGRASENPVLALRRYQSGIRLYSRALRATRRASRHDVITQGCAGGMSALLDSAKMRAKALKGG